ncbi:hypothetical protein L1049_017142 [Liquidambar formosana]|uniref:Zinc finger BED domain-containing protein RICESLEEPER 2-like n=1 Tax=Liquidambar formosana TaxID=63359 RepID=A0AAP0S7N0_LIQFO
MSEDSENHDYSIIRTSNKKRKLDSNEPVFDERKACRAVAGFIRSEKLGFWSIENKSFQEFVRMLYPQFHIDRHMVERECIEIYKEEKAKIKETLRNLDGHISLSVEILKYERFIGDKCELSYFNDYMRLSAHFIDEKWRTQKWVLNFCFIYPSHPLGEAILKSLSDWDIENKISTLTLGYNEDCDKTFQIAQDRLHEKKKLKLSGQMFRVKCCADLFCSMAEDAFEEIEEIIRKVRPLTKWEKSLPTWSFTLGKLQVALAFESLGVFIEDRCVGFEIPSAEEWKKVQGVCKLVESIHKVATVLFESMPIYSTANVYFHLLQELHATLTRESTGSDGFIITLAEKMLKTFDQYWKDMFLVLAIAAVLDPRFKMKYIEFSSSKYEGSDGNSKVTMVVESIHSLYEDYVTHNPQKENSPTESSPPLLEDESSDDDDEEPSRNPYDDFSLFQEYCQLIDSTSQPAKSELDWYLEEPVLPWVQNFDALSWWRAASPKYPTLSRMARDFLAMPTTVPTPSEAYYTKPREVDHRIVSLGSELVNALMCPGSWF